ncbi:MAG TPA: hypothetical protein VMW73_02450, partial [Spirochaetia bacterium]|nr:hypothetical protein [Spirochaetia bacterium]
NFPYIGYGCGHTLTIAANLPAPIRGRIQAHLCPISGALPGQVRSPRLTDAQSAHDTVDPLSNEGADSCSSVYLGLLRIDGLQTDSLFLRDILCRIDIKR